MRSPAVSEWPGFTPEGYRLYEAATRRIRRALANGHTYDQACSALHDVAPSLRAFISDDFLKILVAEEHFGADVAIDDLALSLGLPYERIEAAMLSLLDEMVQETDVITPCLHNPGSSLTH